MRFPYSQTHLCSPRASPCSAFTTCRCLVEDKSTSWGEILPLRIIKVKVSFDVLTVGGSNYKDWFEILVSTLLQKCSGSQVHLNNLSWSESCSPWTWETWWAFVPRRVSTFLPQSWRRCLKVFPLWAGADMAQQEWGNRWGALEVGNREISERRCPG